MSTYPRVFQFHGSTDYYRSANGGHIVVPADAIVIDKASLPEVDPHEGSARVPGYPVGSQSAEKARALALAWLALAEYLAAHPPVPPVSDEDVETLAGLLWEYAQNPSGPGDEFAETSDGERNRFRNRARRVLTARGPSGERLTVTR
jgi:hypothetical protein